MHINENTLNEETINYLKDVLRKEGFTEECQVHISEGSSIGDNYAGLIFRANIKENQKNLQLILKTPHLDKVRRDYMQSNKIWQKEADFYTKIFPALDKFQKSKKNNNFFDDIPKCYEANLEVIIMEDLKVCGYVMGDRIKGLNYKQIKLLIQKLAQFHALSFAFKDQQPEVYAPIGELGKEVLFGDIIRQEMFEKYFEPSLVEYGKLFDDLELKEKSMKFILNYFNTVLELTQGTNNNGPYTCMNHGDCWVNNMLFKYSETNEIESLKLLDFQINRQTSPIMDLSYLIMCSTDKPLRDEHLDRLLDLYIELLHQNIKELGSNPEKVYPRSIYEEHIMKYMKFGVSMAIMCVPLFTASKEDIPDFDHDFLEDGAMAEMTEKHHELMKTDVVKTRFTGIMGDAVGRGYI